MFLEYYLDCFLNDQEIKDTLNSIKSIQKIDSILINEHQYRLSKLFFNPSKINIYCDFPLGLSTADIRLKNLESISNKSSIISIQAPSCFLINRKYDKIRKEIEQIKNIIPKDTEIRYIVDYRKYNHNILNKFCSILKENNIHTVYPSTTFFLDNIYDNIIASKYLEKNSKIKVIFNGNFWTQDHVDLIIKSKPAGITTQHIQSLYLMKDHLNESQAE